MPADLLPRFSLSRRAWTAGSHSRSHPYREHPVLLPHALFPCTLSIQETLFPPLEVRRGPGRDFPSLRVFSGSPPSSHPTDPERPPHRRAPQRARYRNRSRIRPGEPGPFFLFPATRKGFPLTAKMRRDTTGLFHPAVPPPHLLYTFRAGQEVHNCNPSSFSPAFTPL